MWIAIALAAVFAAALLATRRSAPLATQRSARLQPGVPVGGLKPAPTFGPKPAPVSWTRYGVRFFAFVAGIALFLAAVFGVQSAQGAGWLLPAAGLLLGAALLFVCWRGLAPGYSITANAIGGAGIGTLYATLYALHQSWNVPLLVTFLAMAAVTVIAVLLALHRDSLFLALLGLAGGFAIPALLGFDEHALALFSYLLLLNAGLAWVAYRKDWPLLTALAITLTVVYEWAWVLRFLTYSRLPLAAAIFAILAAAGAAALWKPPQSERPMWFRNAAAAAALLPLLFAFYIATQANYAQRFNVLFGFLFVVAAGLVAIVWRGGPRWLHTIGGIAVLATFFLWFAHWFRQLEVNDLFPPQPVPNLVLYVCLWLALFVVLYLIGPTVFAALLFFVFIGLAMRQPVDATTLIIAMLLLLALLLYVTIRARRPLYGAIAAVLASLAIMALTPLPALWRFFPSHALDPAPRTWLLVAVQAIVFAALFAIAWNSGRGWVSILAVPLYAAMIATTSSSPLAALIAYLLFVAYAFFVPARDSVTPYVSLVLASVVLLLTTWSPWTALLVAAVMFGLLLRWWIRGDHSSELRFALIASALLAFFNAAVAMLLPNSWTAVLWAFEAATLVAVYRRFAKTTLLVWAIGLAVVVALWITFDSPLYIWWVFVAIGMAMYVAAYFAEERNVRLFFSLVGLTEHWLLINILVADWYDSTGVALNSSFGFASPVEDMTYTIAWAVVATFLFIIGMLLPWRGARVGASSLLIATSLKCFVHDLARLDGAYRVTSLVVLAVSFLIVSVVLQRFGEKSDNGLAAAVLK